jgi:MFS family permease
MTDLDLICEQPYVIGLLGAISFISFSLGSLMLTDLIDTHGRKNVVIGASLVTPIGIFLLFIVNNIYYIYAIMFVIGLTYNPRSSVAYLYGSEFLQKKDKLKFGAYNFTLSGIFQFLSAIWFYYTKN